MSQPLREVSNLTTAGPNDAKYRHTSRTSGTGVTQPPPPLPPQTDGNYRGTAAPRLSYTYFTSQSSATVSVVDNTTAVAPPRQSEAPTFGTSSSSPRYPLTGDTRHAHDPTHCTELIGDISETLLEREYQAVHRFNEGADAHESSSLLYRYYASPHYLRHQPEVNEKMRMILIDWLIDVHLKFKLHPETMYLAVNLIDRYLSCVNTRFNAANFVPRGQLQLVGVSAMLLAAKYEEIWPPEVRECVHISANTYTRDEIIKMERSICTALAFRLTVPTPYSFATRLFSLLEGEDLLGLNSNEEARRQQHALLCHMGCFYMEHALLDYKCLQFAPSQVANACVFLALVSLHKHYEVPLPAQVWPETLRRHSRCSFVDFRGCVEVVLEYVSYVPTTRYQAVRRKYSNTRFGEVAKMTLCNEVPLQ